MKTLKPLLIGCLLFGSISVIAWLNFKVWALKHPDAPLWLYFFSPD